MDIGEKVVKLEIQMETALAGVSNFREFQTEARDFFSRSDEREKERAKAEEARLATEEARLAAEEARSQKLDSNRSRLNLILTIGLLIVGAFAAWIGYLAYRNTVQHGELFPSAANVYHYDVAERTTK